ISPFQPSYVQVEVPNRTKGDNAMRHCTLMASVQNMLRDIATSLHPPYTGRLLMSHESRRRRASETIVFRLGPGKCLLLVASSLLLAYGIALVDIMVCCVAFWQWRGEL